MKFAKIVLLIIMCILLAITTVMGCMVFVSAIELVMPILFPEDAPAPTVIADAIIRRDNTSNKIDVILFILPSFLVFHTTRTHRFDNVRLRDNEYENRNHHHQNGCGCRSTGTLDTARDDLTDRIVEGFQLL